MLLLCREEERVVFFFICEGREGCAEGLRREGDCPRRRGSVRDEGAAMREVNFVLDGQTHVDWPAEGLSSTGAPGQPALHRTCTRCGASTPSLIQSALHPPPC